MNTNNTYNKKGCKDGSLVDLIGAEDLSREDKLIIIDAYARLFKSKLFMNMPKEIKDRRISRCNDIRRMIE